MTMMMAQVCNLELGEFVHTFGDAHLYSNHMEQAKQQCGCEHFEDAYLQLSDEEVDA